MEIQHGAQHALSFVTNLLVAIFVAYLAKQALAAGAEGMEVLRFTGAAAIGFYGSGSLMCGIWFGQFTRAFITNAFDAVVYGVVSGAIFLLTWPAADTAAIGVILTA